MNSMPEAASSIAPTEVKVADRPIGDPPGASSKKHGFRAFESRNFKLLWIGLLISNAGTWMDGAAQGWLVTDIKHDGAAFWLGLISMAFAVPMIVLTPFGGAIADRFPRVRLLWIVQILYITASATLSIIVITGVVQVWMLVVYSFVNGVVLAVDSPTRHALLPDIVTREQLPAAVSLNSVAFTGAGLVGPALGGALIPLIGVGGVLSFNAISCIAILVALKKLRDVPDHSTTQTSPANVLTSIREGVAFVRGSRLLMGLILISAASGLLIRSYNPMLAVFAREVFDINSIRYGLLLSAGGLGTLIGGFGIAARRDVRLKGRWVMIAVLAQAAFLLMFAVVGIYGVALPALALVGVVNAIAGALIATLIQLAAPGHLRGRVMSLYLMCVVGVPSIGSFALGSLAELVNVQFTVGAAAVVFLAIAAVIFGRNAELRHAT
jgi:MFS family permease